MGDSVIEVSVEYLRECFQYAGDTGELSWKLRPQSHFSSERAAKTWNARFAGKSAGAIQPRGYIVVNLGLGRIYAHRIIWAIVYGAFPSSWIDHIDSDPSNNKISNLRAATPAQNNRNRRVSRTNKTGYKGVYKRRDRYVAIIVRANRKQVHIGTFDTPAEAHSAYLAEAQKHFGEFARGNK